MIQRFPGRGARPRGSWERAKWAWPPSRKGGRGPAEQVAAAAGVPRHPQPSQQATGLTSSCPSQAPSPCPDCPKVGEQAPGCSSAPISKGLPTPDLGVRHPSPPDLTPAQPWACLQFLPHPGAQDTHLASGGDGAQADPWFLNHTKELIQRFSHYQMCGNKYESLRGID